MDQLKELARSFERDVRRGASSLPAIPDEPQEWIIGSASALPRASSTHAVGTALTIQTSPGFALNAASIWWTVEMANRLS